MVRYILAVKRSDIVFAAGCVLALAAGAASVESAVASSSEGVSATSENQILVEMVPGDVGASNLFDLNGRTLVFTPDGLGGYSRSVRPVAWEDEIGPAVADGAEITLRGFTFDFGGRGWTTFFVNRPGLITFGERLSYSYEAEGRFDTMQKIADNFVRTPTISALFKPWHEGTQYVASSIDRVVVTWISTEPEFYVHGVPPEEPARLQAVLTADGSIRLSYLDVSAGDGVVGLFTEGGTVKGALIGRFVDETDSELPAHLDLLEVAVYESNTDAVILEFTTRGPVPEPASGSVYSYRVHFDTDRPWWPGLDFSEVDLTWAVDVHEGGRRTAWGPGVVKVAESDGANRLSLLANLGDLQGASASVVGDVVQFDAGDFVANDISLPALIELPTDSIGTRIDLSMSDGRFIEHQSEVFHYQSVLDLDAITCRVVEALGDEFDLFVFHTQSRVDVQESTTPFNPYAVGAEGLGVPTRGQPPCGARLKGRWSLPVWIRAGSVFDSRRREGRRFDRGLGLFTHEFTHAWTAHMSYLRDGMREPLVDGSCRCHWRFGLHTPVTFLGRPDNPTPSSTMGGRYWRDNGNGTFTPHHDWPNTSLSWLDLYAMGLADASEVPDMFILRNLRPVREGEYWGPHTGEREWLSIEQIVAAEGPRKPSAQDAQKDFNAGFVYLVAPGRAPDDDMLRLHAEHRARVVEHWNRITGGRSRMTTNVAE